MTPVYRAHPAYSHAIAWTVRIIASLIAAVWLIPVVAMGSGEQLSAALVRFPLFASVSLFTMGMLTVIALREKRSVTFTLTDEAIVKDTISTRQTLPFTAVRRFEYRRIPFVGGRGYLCAPSGAMVLPITITDAEGLLQEVRQCLDRQDTAGIVSGSTAQLFLRDAQLMDRALDRLCAGFHFAYRAIVLTFVGGFFVARTFWGFYLPWALLWAMVGALFPLAGIFTALSATMWREYRMTAKNGRIEDSDHQVVFVHAGWITLLAYLSTGIFVSQTW